MDAGPIIGSVRDGRFGPTVAEWFVSRIEGPFEVDVIDLADVKFPLNMPSYGTQPSLETAEILKNLTPRLERAGAFVVITPECNHSYPAWLKNLEHPGRTQPAPGRTPPQRRRPRSLTWAFNPANGGGGRI